MPTTNNEALPPIVVPALPDLPGIELKLKEEDDDDVVADEDVSEAAAAAALACCVDDGPEEVVADDHVAGGGGGNSIIKTEEDGDNIINIPNANNRIRRNKKLPLNPHEALTFYQRGIYIDVDPSNLAAANAAASAANSSTSTTNNNSTNVGESLPSVSGELVAVDNGVTDSGSGDGGGGGTVNNLLLFSTGIIRCSCNHKPTYKWDAYGYSRHFEFKCHKKYEEERLNDIEATRLKESKESYLRMYPPIPESNLSLVQSRKKRKFHEDHVVVGGATGDNKMQAVEELRIQERHWMEMWKEAKNELKQLREDLKNESDEEVRKELLLDIEGWKKRKGDWAKLLGLNEGSSNGTTPLKEENAENDGNFASL